jgi:uncharacterized membrane protein YozB (DUF420 family)
MSHLSDTFNGIAFVILAAANVVVMLEASQPSRKVTTRNRLIALHRVGGYLFVILFCIMAYSMSQKLTGSGITGDLPAYLILHIVLVFVLVPLLLLKILVARRYKQSHSSLKVIGITIFVISILLVAIPVFSELLRSAGPGRFGLWLTTHLVIRQERQQGIGVVGLRPPPASFIFHARLLSLLHSDLYCCGWG